MLNMNTVKEVDDITLGLAISRNNETHLSRSHRKKSQVSQDAVPSSPEASGFSPLTMEHPGPAVNDVTEEAAPENGTVPLSKESSTSDMPKLKGDECLHSSILSIKNKIDTDKNVSGISNGQIEESNILKSLAENIPDTEPGEGVVSSVSVRQNCPSKVAAVRRDVQQGYPIDRDENDILVSQESSEISTTGISMNVLSEVRRRNSLESSLRKYTQVINNGTATGESPVSGFDSESSNLEAEAFSCDKNATDPLLPEFLKVILEGMNVCGDSGCPSDSKPEWFDFDKFRRGQRFAMKYLFGLVLAETLSLLVIFSIPNSLRPLIFTKKSDTPYKSFKRYLSTAVRVRSWYLDDIWQHGTEGHKNIQVVRAMHQKVRDELHNTTLDEVYKRATLTGNCTSACKGTPIWSPLHRKIREDFQGSCPYPRPNQRPFLGYRKNPVFVNQMDMVITQFAFVGLFILFPEKFGAHGVSDEDLNSFVHLWHCLGYVLGIEDRYNFCNGDLETVRQRSRDIINFWMKPSLRDISRDWEHMTRCIVKGIGYYIPAITYEVSLLYLCSILSIYAPRIRAALTFTQVMVYHLMNFVFLVLCRLPGVYLVFNWLLSFAFARAQKISPKLLSKLEKKQYPYEEQACCTRL